MSSGARMAAFWALFAVTMAIYALMVLWTLPGIAADAGSPAFDMRPAGYSHAEAQAFLGGLTDSGRSIYEGPQRVLDLAYPALLALVLSWSAFWATHDRAPAIGLAICALALLGMCADYAENAAVARMLTAGADGISEAQVGWAARFTLVKSGATTLAMVALLLMVVRRVVGGQQS